MQVDTIAQFLVVPSVVKLVDFRGSDLNLHQKLLYFAQCIIMHVIQCHSLSGYVNVAVVSF